MRPLTSLLCLLALITSCRSNKAIQKDIALNVDSVAQSSHHRTVAVIDSAATRLSLDFDTLDITIERQVADVPEVVRLRAVKGKVVNAREHQKRLAEHHEKRDKLAYKMAAADNSAEHSATTRVYDPPNSGVVIFVSLLIIAGLAYFTFRRKL